MKNIQISKNKLIFHYLMVLCQVTFQQPKSTITKLLQCVKQVTKDNLLSKWDTFENKGRAINNYARITGMIQDCLGQTGTYGHSIYKLAMLCEIKNSDLYFITIFLK